MFVFSDMDRTPLPTLKGESDATIIASRISGRSHAGGAMC